MDCFFKQTNPPRGGLQMTLVQNMFIANKGVSSSHDREQLMEFFARRYCGREAFAYAQRVTGQPLWTFLDTQIKSRPGKPLKIVRNWLGN